MARPRSSSVSVSRRRPTGDASDRTVLWVRGDHDIATKVSIAVGIARAAARQDALVLVDLSAVTFMDASTVGAIVAGRNRVQARGQSLAVRAPSARARRILGLCGLADLIQPDDLHAGGEAAALATWVDVQPRPSSPKIEDDVLVDSPLSARSRS